MPVGMFRPEAKTDAVYPGGRPMLGGRPGLKNAVLFMQSGAIDGFLTTCACETAGNADANASTNTPDKRFDNFDLIVGTPSSPLS